MNDPTTPRIEQLLEHAGWVRRLATRLVNDAAAADDLVQETWATALRRPPSDDRNLRAWLGTVIRNVAAQGRRSNQRRAQREERAASAEADVDSTDAVVSRFETQRNLADLVLALDEPERSTILLRFYEGLTSPEIAVRTGVPEGTVRWRLKKSLDRLRDRLDRKHGGDTRSWCSALAPFLDGNAWFAASTTSAAKSTLLGALAVKTPIKAIVAAVTIAIACTGIYRSGILGTPSPAVPEPTSTTAAAVPSEPESAVASDIAAARRSTADASQATPQPTARTQASVSLRVVDELGNPVRGTVQAGEATAPTDRRGNALLSLTEATEGAVDLAIRATGFVAHQLTVSLRRDGGITEVGNVALVALGEVRGRVFDRSGRPLTDARVELAKYPPRAEALETWRRQRADRTHAAVDPSTGTYRVETDGHGDYRIFLPPGRHQVFAAAAGMLATLSAPLDVVSRSHLHEIDLILEPLSPRETIEGVVIGTDGTLATHAEVRNCGRIDRKAWSDAQGRFRLILTEGESISLRAVNSAGSSVSDVVRADAGDRGITLQLLPTVEVPFTATASGRPLKRFEVTSFDELGGLALGAQEVEVDATPATVRVPATNFLLRVEAEGFELLTLGPYRVPPARIECDLAQREGLRGRVTAGGDPVAGASVSWHAPVYQHVEVAGFAVHLQPRPWVQTKSDASGEFQLPVSADTAGTVRVTAEGFAPAEVGPLAASQWSPLEIELDLGGAIEGRVVHIERNAERAIVAISRGDGQPQSRRVDGDGRFHFERLTPGPWQVRLVDRDLSESTNAETRSRPLSPVRFRADCQVVSGQTTWFDFSQVETPQHRMEGRLQVRETRGLTLLAALHELDAEPGAPSAASADVDASGRFELTVDSPGDYLLVVRSSRRDSPFTVFEPVTVRGDDNEWFHSLDSGGVSIENVPPFDPSGLDAEAHFLFWETDGIQIVSDPLMAAGTVHLPAVPAGWVRLIRVPLSAVDPLGLGEHDPLLRFEIPAGGEVTIQIPD